MNEKERILSQIKDEEEKAEKLRSQIEDSSKLREYLGQKEPEREAHFE
jgi:hypothetical protein